MEKETVDLMKNVNVVYEMANYISTTEKFARGLTQDSPTIRNHAGFRRCPAPFSNYYASYSGKLVGRKRHILSTIVNNAGYEMVEVQKDNGQHTTTTVHRLVALVWVKKPETNSRLIVDHVNDCKTDNRASNLHWVTYHYNLVKHHRMEKMSGNNSYTHGHAVEKISEDGHKDFYKSLSAAARANNLSVTSVQGSANRTLNLNKPYHFEFAQSDKQEEK